MVLKQQMLKNTPKKLAEELAASLGLVIYWNNHPYQLSGVNKNSGVAIARVIGW